LSRTGARPSGWIGAIWLIGASLAGAVAAAVVGWTDVVSKWVGRTIDPVLWLAADVAAVCLLMALGAVLLIIRRPTPGPGPARAVGQPVEERPSLSPVPTDQTLTPAPDSYWPPEKAVGRAWARASDVVSGSDNN
jgi:hypothetical protein